MSAPELLRLEDLSVRFPGRPAPAVRGVTLDVRAGETLALVGPSGGGKSVSLRAALGLLPAAVRVEGRVLWEGDDVLVWPAARRRGLLGRRIGLVFQDPGASLNPCLTVGRHLDEVLARLTDLRGHDRRARGDDLLRQVRLHDAGLWRARYPHQLSGGQQQRVALALALAGDPDLLVADEPTTSLDAVVRGEVLDLLDELQARRGLALIHVTHDLALVRGRAGRVAVLAAGAVVEQDAAAAILAGGAHPVTRDFVAAARAAPARSPAPPAPPVLSVKGLQARYGRRRGPGDAGVLRGLDLQLEQGRVYGLLGVSGAGKTTLARVLAGFHDAAAGSVESPAGRPGGPRPVQLVFQNPAAALDPRLSAAAAVAEAAAAAGEAAPEARARELLAAADLPPEAWSLRPHALSGGQRQRVALARTLAAAPRIIVADEPAASLDPPARLRLLATLAAACRDRGVALLLISHDPGLLRRAADRIGVLSDGVLVDEFPVDGHPDHPLARRLWDGSAARPENGESAERH